MPRYSEQQRQAGISKLLTLTREELDLITGYLTKNPLQMLQIFNIRTLLTQFRLKRLHKQSVQVFEGDKSSLIDQAIEHNLDGLMHGWSLMRPVVLTYPLFCLSAIHRRISDVTVLTIGPRTEAELLTLVSMGFRPQNITGLDLMSYNTMVDVGDMHAMPYDDASFDVVMAGWVLVYSSDQQRAAAEILRVVKPGGFIAIGCEHSPAEDPSKEAFFEKQGLSRRLTNDDEKAVWSEEKILALFGERVRKVVFVSDESDNPELNGIGVVVIFQVT